VRVNRVWIVGRRPARQSIARPVTLLRSKLTRRPAPGVASRISRTKNLLTVYFLGCIYPHVGQFFFMLRERCLSRRSDSFDSRELSFRPVERWLRPRQSMQAILFGRSQVAIFLAYRYGFNPKKNSPPSSNKNRRSRDRAKPILSDRVKSA